MLLLLSSAIYGRCGQKVGTLVRACSPRPNADKRGPDTVARALGFFCPWLILVLSKLKHHDLQNIRLLGTLKGSWRTRKSRSQAGTTTSTTPTE